MNRGFLLGGPGALGQVETLITRREGKSKEYLREVLTQRDRKYRSYGLGTKVKTFILVSANVDITPD